MSNWKLALVVLLVHSPIYLIYAAESLDSQTALSTSTEKFRSKRVFGLSGKLAFGGARTTEQADGQASLRYSSLTAELSHKASEIAFAAASAYTQTWTDQDPSLRGSFDNPVFRLKKNWSVVKWLNSFSAGLTTTQIGNEESRKRGFRGSIGASLEGEKLFGRVMLNQAFSFSQAAYEQDHSPVTGDANVSNILRSSSIVEFVIIEKLAINGNYLWYFTRDRLEGGIVRDLWTASLKYTFNSMIEANLGYGPGFGLNAFDPHFDQLANMDSGAKQAFLEVAIAI